MQTERQLYIENQCKWRTNTRFRQRRCKWSVQRGETQREWSVWSDTNKVENIKLFRQHCTATSNQRRVQANDVTSLTYDCLHSDQHGGEANCSCVWAPTRANRSSNWAPVSLRYRWNRSSSRRSSWRRQWNSPSSVCLRRTSWTKTWWLVAFRHFSAHWWYQPWSTWKESGLRNTGSKMGGQALYLFFTPSVKSDKCE